MTVHSLLEARAALRAGQTSSLELTQHALEAARTHAGLNAFAVLDEAGALETAGQLDSETRVGKARGALHGVPISVKDLFNVVGLPTRAGTAAPLPLEFQGAVTDSVAVSRLRASGAVIIGKTNMHEIALGITGENAHTGDVKNPLESARQAGGSSSGSAASVAVGAGYGSLGSDTGGSVRIPASFCGVVGFKPTFGLVPLEGALHLSTTCDHAGPIARTVADAHALLEVLAHRNLPLRALDSLRGLRFGVPRVWLEGRLGVAVRRDFEALLERLRDAGASVSDVQPHALERAGEAYTPLVRAEAAYTHRDALHAHPELFGDNVRTPLLAGASLGVAAYLEARAVRRQVRAGLEASLREVDALVLPCAPLPAPVRGTPTVTLESGDRAHRDAFIELTLPFSLVGVPTLSLPFTRVDGLPVGLQIVTAKGEDALALEVGAWLERALAM
jgi:aspartyl-tRNA(Asn)/glutamyl-tRNA(Gln) amidotransferase subunit A